MFVLFLFQKKNKCVRERRGVRTAVKGIPVNRNQPGGHKTRSIKATTREPPADGILV